MGLDAAMPFAGNVMITSCGESAAGVNLPGAGHPQTWSDCAKRDSTKTSVTSLKELQAPAAEAGQTLHTATNWLDSSTAQALWESGNEEKSHIKSQI